MSTPGGSPSAARFFLLNPSRRPKWRIPSNYPKSSADANWNDEVTGHDFIVPPTEVEGMSVSQSMVADINTANNKLLPLFFQLDYQAKVNQNKFYWVQYIFVIGAFITTLLGALTVTAIPAPSTDPAQIAAQAQNTLAASSDSPTLAKVFAALAAVSGVLTGFATMIRNREKPQEQWYKYRRWAETLRMHYFEYLAHVTPYDGPNRIDKLNEAVKDLRVEEKTWQIRFHQ